MKAEHENDPSGPTQEVPIIELKLDTEHACIPISDVIIGSNAYKFRDQCFTPTPPDFSFVDGEKRYKKPTPHQMQCKSLFDNYRQEIKEKLNLENYDKEAEHVKKMFQSQEPDYSILFESVRNYVNAVTLTSDDLRYLHYTLRDKRTFEKYVLALSIKCQPPK